MGPGWRLGVGLGFLQYTTGAQRGATRSNVQGYEIDRLVLPNNADPMFPMIGGGEGQPCSLAPLLWTPRRAGEGRSQGHCSCIRGAHGGWVESPCCCTVYPVHLPRLLTYSVV